MQVFRVLLTASFLAAPVALFAQDKPKPTEKPDQPMVNKYEEEFLKAARKALGEKPKADETKPAKPTEAKPADPKPKQFELEFKIVPNTPAKAKPDEPKPEKPADPKSKAAQYKEEVQKAVEAELKEAQEMLIRRRQELQKAAEALAEAAKKANTPQKADEPRPADAKPDKAEEARTAERARLYLRLMSEAERKAKADEAKPAKPAEPQKPGKPVEVQLQYKVEKDGDADKLQKLEAQLQALLQEIQAMRRAKSGGEKKPIEPQTTPEQKKALRVYPDDKPRVLVVPAQPGAPPIARPPTPYSPGTPAPVYPPAEALERRTVRARLINGMAAT